MHRRMLLISVVLILCCVLAAGCRSHDPAGIKASQGITPTNKLRVKSALGNPSVDPKTWRLKVEGLVSRPIALNLDQVRALPSVTEEVEMHCIEGWSERAVWKGVPLSDVLRMAGMDEAKADRVVFVAAEGYDTSIMAKDAMRPGMILAYEVNGEPLPKDLGFPLRLVAKNKYGYKWIKWIEKIKVIAGEHRGYWEGFGYDNEGEVLPESK